MKIPDQLKELAHQWVDGAEIQILTQPLSRARILAGEPPTKVDPVWVDDPEPKWLPNEYYRVKPRPASIDWSHVKKGWNFCARARNGIVNLYTHEPKPSTINDAWCLLGIGDIADATLFASYDPGDTEWNASLIKRPGAD